VTEYLLEKLSEINRRMAIHQADAKGRLASECENLLLLGSNGVPERYSKDFNELLSRIKLTIESLPVPGMTPIKIVGTTNRTAIKYIELLINVEESLKDEAT
jgi:hypothetical protein